MHLNVRQMKALAAVAPGTLRYRENSRQPWATFALTDDDAHRCGYHTLAVNTDGSVMYIFPNAGSRIESYDTIMQRQREAQAEQDAELSALVGYACTGYLSSVTGISHDGPTCPIHEA
jgi:hypothetical protein